MKEPEDRKRHEREEEYQIKDAREEEYRIRKARKEDLEAVAEIERRSIPDPWSRKGFAEALGRPEVIFLVAEKEAERRKIAGYCVLYTAADEGEIPTIAVDFGSRRR